MPAAAVQPEPRDPAALDRIFDDSMMRFGLPGMAMGVIEDGEVVHVRTGGETAAGSDDPVTSATLFKIASNSKAMTAAVLARLVDAGKLRWDDPVTRHLPRFRMYEDWVTREMQVRDLLIHNSGLPEGAGDLMLWPEPNDFGRADIIAGLAHLRPERSFRSGYAYDNLLYVVAGEVAAAAGGASYESLVRREVFDPLGLSGCRVGEWTRTGAGSVAQPHMRTEQGNAVIRADGEVVPAITSAAAGGIRCSLDDMLLWAHNWLQPTAEQLQWLSQEQRTAMWTAHTLLPVSARSREWDGTHIRAYGYGWRLADVHGEWTISHTGTLAGMYSVLMLLPDRRSGFVVMINGDGSDARSVITSALLDYFVRPEADTRVDALADRLERERDGAGRSRMPDTSGRTPAHALDMAAYLGIYRDPWFGEVSLCDADGGVRFASARSPRLSGRVMQVHGRALVDWDDDTIDPEAWMDLHGATPVSPPRMTMAKVDPDGDFSSDYEDLAFERVGGCGG
ncbi:serine hydrolase domain-containing protein [Marilutibacter chinensis]|uniref:Serine hydrolase n=1 Tax=Marilutibacter chinensis TaxID=2912247 RepID=A0ABS9HYH7_9GAMM|nr:serine hydrolase domain-containing protein [Lysobacter chinensis]MCF7223132.1 serine hydrolase [Lysobacter chinensis]